MKKIVTIGGVLMLVAALLTGCAPEGAPTPGASDTPEPAPTVTAAPSAEPTAEPTSEPAARADFGFTYFREGNLGDNWDQLSSALGHPVVPIVQCPWYANLEQSPTAYTNVLWDTDILGSGVSLFYTSLIGTSVEGTFPRNAEGVGIGSSRAQVLAAYPGAVVDSVTPVGEGTVTRILVNDPNSDSQYAFGITGYSGANTVDRLQWGLGGAGGVWDHLCEGS